MISQVMHILKRDRVVSVTSLAMELKTSKEKISTILEIMRNQGLLNNVSTEPVSLGNSCAGCAGNCSVKCAPDFVAEDKMLILT